MKIAKTLKLSTYSCSVHIVVTDDLKNEVDKIYKKNNLSDRFEDDAEAVMLTINLHNYYLIFDKDYLTHNTIAHEVFHVVIRITDDRDITDDEAQAWLTGYITSVIYEFLDKKNLNIEHGG